MINFNVPPVVGNELLYLSQAIEQRKLCGDGEFTRLSSELLEAYTKSSKVLLTTSCTHALEMAAILCDIKQDDEVIMPSYTFVSTANAFVLRGARIVFVDINPLTMNIDENLVEDAITDKTRAIVPVHYAGVSCNMNRILEIATEFNLYVVEDAAQGVGSTYHGKKLGSIGDFGAYSFHETKNISCGEGGALLINHPQLCQRAEIIREKGTNRSQFFRGEVDKYSWCDIGSSYLPSELNAAYLYAQLESIELINKNRMQSWNYYYEALNHLKKLGRIDLPYLPEGCEHNAHMFWIKVKDLEERSQLIKHLRTSGIYSVFHYIPLHSSEAGLKFGRLSGVDQFTTMESERLLRLPLYYGMNQRDLEKVVHYVNEFFR